MLPVLGERHLRERPLAAASGRDHRRRVSGAQHLEFLKKNL